LRLARAFAMIAAGALVLPGCAAIAPVMASGIVAKRSADARADRPPVAKVVAEPGAAAQPSPLAGSALPPRTTIAISVPADERPPQADVRPFNGFARFAAVRAAPALGGKPRQSALIDPTTLAGIPRTSSCSESRPAVAIDLDPGQASFDLDNPPLPASGLAETLADMRLAGISVLWVSALPAASEARLHDLIQAIGLDPQRTDHLLLLRQGQRSDRKPARLQAAARDWCIVAVAGDRRGDFEEAYDYLRDPDGPIARTLDANIGNGWFLTPLPIQ